MNNYIEAKAKVLSAEEDKYVIGFECPDCESGYIQTDFKSEDKFEEGALIDVKISKIIMSNGKIETIGFFNDAGEGELQNPDKMPDIVQQARETPILAEYSAIEKNLADHLNNLDQTLVQKVLPQITEEKLTEMAKEYGINQYKITEKLQDKVYKLHDEFCDKDIIGYTNKEFDVDTLADRSDFEKLAEEHECENFTLIHHWWNNGEYEHWDLFLEDGQAHFVLSQNPLKETEIKSAQREPYSEDFWLRGEEIEEIAPESPGNPSKSMICHVERVDMGKMVLYEAAPQMDGSVTIRLEFLGSKLEGRWLFTSKVPGIWHVLKETMQLSEKQPMPILLSGEFGEWEEDENGHLLIEGTALSFGVWNGFYWSPETIANSPVDDFDNLIVDVEHDNNKPVGAVIEKTIVGPDINVKAKITDYETIERIKNGEYKGFSIDATVFADPQRRMIEGVKQYKRLTVCENPACKTCFFS